MGHGILRRVRAEKRLKAKDIDKLPAGVHEDGGGLRLVVEPSGSRRWVLRVTISGKRHNRGLGPYPLIMLDAARDSAIDMRRAAREGRDLARERRQQAARASKRSDKRGKNIALPYCSATLVCSRKSGLMITFLLTRLEMCSPKRNVSRTLSLARQHWTQSIRRNMSACVSTKTAQ